jgi:hypothetical protein
MNKSYSLVCFLLLIPLVLPGCGRKSSTGVDAMSGKDWFKSGVDRFYLAHTANDKRILEQYPQTYGDRYFIGIGCYDEPKDPKTNVLVPASRGSTKMVEMSLDSRSMLYQFNIVESKKPKNGECRILLGDTVSPQQISNGNALENKNTDYGVSSGDAAQKIGAASLSCFTFAASAVKFGGAVVAGTAVTVKTAGAASPFVVPLLATEVASLASSGLFCVLWVNWAKESVHNFKISENQKLFSESMNKASKLTIKAMQEDGSIDTYNELVLSQDPEKIAVASAIWNKKFVKAFNTKVNDEFENGWGSETKFFDAVEKIQTEYLSSAATFK